MKDPQRSLRVFRVYKGIPTRISGSCLRRIFNTFDSCFKLRYLPSNPSEILQKHDVEIHVRAFTRLIQLKKKKNFALLQYAHFKGGTWFKSTSLHSHNAIQHALEHLAKDNRRTKRPNICRPSAIQFLGTDAPCAQLVRYFENFCRPTAIQLCKPTHLAPNLYDTLGTFADLLQSNV